MAAIRKIVNSLYGRSPGNIGLSFGEASYVKNRVAALVFEASGGCHTRNLRPFCFARNPLDFGRILAGAYVAAPQPLCGRRIASVWLPQRGHAVQEAREGREAREGWEAQEAPVARAKVEATILVR